MVSEFSFNSMRLLITLLNVVMTNLGKQFLGKHVGLVADHPME